MVSMSRHFSRRCAIILTIQPPLLRKYSVSTVHSLSHWSRVCSLQAQRSLCSSKGNLPISIRQRLTARLITSHFSLSKSSFTIQRQGNILNWLQSRIILVGSASLQFFSFSFLSFLSLGSTHAATEQHLPKPRILTSSPRVMQMFSTQMKQPILRLWRYCSSEQTCVMMCSLVARLIVRLLRRRQSQRATSSSQRQNTHPYSYLGGCRGMKYSLMLGWRLPMSSSMANSCEYSFWDSWQPVAWIFLGPNCSSQMRVVQSQRMAVSGYLWAAGCVYSSSAPSLRCLANYISFFSSSSMQSLMNCLSLGLLSVSSWRLWNLSSQARAIWRILKCDSSFFSWFRQIFLKWERFLCAEEMSDRILQKLEVAISDLILSSSFSTFMQRGKPGLTFIPDFRQGSLASLPRMISSMVLKIISDSSPTKWQRSLMVSRNFCSSSRMEGPLRKQRVTETEPVRGWARMKMLRQDRSLYRKANLLSSMRWQFHSPPTTRYWSSRWQLMLIWPA